MGAVWVRNRTILTKSTWAIILSAIAIHLCIVTAVFLMDAPPYLRSAIGCDFWSLPQAGYDLRLGNGIYLLDEAHNTFWGPIGFPYVLPPWIAVILGLPLSFLSPTVAYILFVVLLEISLGFLAFICWKLTGNPRLAPWAVALCLIAAPQLTIIRTGQTDTFLALGAALILWGLFKNKPLSFMTGLVLLLFIKPLALFLLPAIIIQKIKIRVSFWVFTSWILLVLLFLLLTFMTNPNLVTVENHLFSALKPGETALKLDVVRPRLDFIFQFFKFSTFGKFGSVPVFIAQDQSFTNFLRVLWLPALPFVLLALFLALLITFKNRPKLPLAAVSLWLLMPFLVLSIVWDQYFLLVLPVCAYLAGRRNDFKPLIAGFILLLPLLSVFMPKTEFLLYPLNTDLLPFLVFNLGLRMLALGYLLLCITGEMMIRQKERD